MRSKYFSSVNGGGTSAYVANMSVASSYIVLLSVFGFHKGAQAWLQIHESAGAPNAGTVPVHTFAVFQNDNYGMIIPVTGLPLSKCFIGLSSTADTYTAIATENVTICGTVQG